MATNKQKAKKISKKTKGYAPNKEHYRTYKQQLINALPAKYKKPIVRNRQKLYELLINAKKEVYVKSSLSTYVPNLTSADVAAISGRYTDTAALASIYLNHIFKGAVHMSEVYWYTTNLITAWQALFANQEAPLSEVSATDYTNHVVWVQRYLLELAYTKEVPLETLKQLFGEYAHQVYREITADQPHAVTYLQALQRGNQLLAYLTFEYVLKDVPIATIKDAQSLYTGAANYQYAARLTEYLTTHVYSETPADKPTPADNPTDDKAGDADKPAPADNPTDDKVGDANA